MDDYTIKYSVYRYTVISKRDCTLLYDCMGHNPPSSYLKCIITGCEYCSVHIVKKVNKFDIWYLHCINCHRCLLVDVFKLH